MIVHVEKEFRLGPRREKVTTVMDEDLALPARSLSPTEVLDPHSASLGRVEKRLRPGDDHAASLRLEGDRDVDHGAA
jgi:hypothetical protein